MLVRRRGQCEDIAGSRQQAKPDACADLLEWRIWGPHQAILLDPWRSLR